MTVPKATPHNITARESSEEAIEMLSGADPVIFTHVVLSVHSSEEIAMFMDSLFARPGAGQGSSQPPATTPSNNTTLVVITDSAQRRAVERLAPGFNYDELQRERRLRFVHKPLKPSKFAAIFDPKKERELSTDRSLEGAQAVAVSQKQVFAEIKRRLGGKGLKVLLVEDNKTNQMVLLKFLGRAGVAVEAVMDGVQCTEKVFGNGIGAYSIILCDLHMPNKDGYQTCKEIRRWERKNRYRHLPIIALSANVLGDVYAKCVEAGFNWYVTKPVDFKELGDVMIRFLDPEQPGKSPPFMKLKDEGNR